MKFLIIAAIIAVASAALSPEDAELVKSTWGKIHNNQADILHAILKAHPDIQAKFPSFAGKDLEEIKGSEDFLSHANTIVAAISKTVALAGNPENLEKAKALVGGLAHNHKARGVTKDQFNEFRASLTDYAAAHAPWGDNVASAWNNAIDLIYGLLFAALDE